MGTTESTATASSDLRVVSKMAGSCAGRFGGGHALLFAVGIGASFAASAQWTFTPEVELRAVYTDNVSLAAEGEEESDLVGVLTPGFELQREDDTLAVDLDYRLQAIGYLDSGDFNQIFQQINAELNSALVDDRLFIDVSSALYQQVADPENPFIQNNIAQTGNRTDTLDLELGATWRQTIGNSVDFEVGHTQGRLQFDLPQLIDTDIASTRISFASPQRGEGITWSLRGNLDRIEYSRSIPEAEFSSFLGEVGYWVGENLRVFANGGVESDYLEHRSEIEYDTPIWTVGFDYRVADRDQLTVSYGQRVFGSNFNLNWLHTLGEKIEVRVDYTEVPSTNAQNARNQIQALQGLASLDGLEELVGLDRPSNADSFVRRRLTAGFQANGNQVTFGLNGFYEERTDRVNPFGMPVTGGDEDAVGGTFFVRWDVGARTRINGNLRVEQATFFTGVEADRLSGLLAVNYDLGSRTDLALEYQYFDGGSDTLDFKENRIALVVGRRFE